MRTLQSLSQIEDPEEFSFAFRNFLDAFYAHPAIEPLMEKPVGSDRTRNAYLAATCDYLCNKYLLPQPSWLTRSDLDDSLVADPPYFASNYWKTRIWLLADSLQEFRQRNIFIGADSLSRT